MEERGLCPPLSAGGAALALLLLTVKLRKQMWSYSRPRCRMRSPAPAPTPTEGGGSRPAGGVAGEKRMRARCITLSMGLASHLRERRGGAVTGLQGARIQVSVASGRWGSVAKKRVQRCPWLEVSVARGVRGE